MMKWLRLHSKKIMAALVLLAMFSFVGGSALYSLLARDPGKTVVMSAFGRDYTQNEVSIARSDTEVLDALLISWKMDAERAFSPKHWLLMAEEADRAGIGVSNEEVEKVMQAQEEQRQSYNMGPLDMLRTSRGMSRTMIRSALRRQMAIMKNAERILRSGMPSEPQLRHYVHATEEKVKVSYVPFDAEKYADPKEPISDDEAQAQFEAYKNIYPEDSEDGFGYKLPQRVKVQYAVASFSAAQQQVPVSFDEIKDYWKKNRASYKKTEWIEEPQPVTSAPASSQPTSQPAPKKKSVQKEKTFTEAQADVERDLRKKKAQQIATRAMRRLADLMAAPWNSLSVDAKTGYKPIPDEAKDPEFLKNLVAKISTEFNITITYSETPLSSRKSIKSLTLIGDAVTPGEGEEPLGLPDYAFRVPSFYSVSEDHASALRLQIFQAPLSPLTGLSRGSYAFKGGRLVEMPGEVEKLVLFRVVEAADAGVPKDMSEVRQHIDSDLHLKHAFQKIEPIARQLQVVATRVGINAALPIFTDIMSTTELKTPAVTPAFAHYSRLPSNELRSAVETNKPTLRVSNIPGVGESKSFVETSFSLAASDWKAAEVAMPDSNAGKAATTQPALAPPPHVGLASDIKQHKWYVIQLVEHEPVNDEQYTDKHRQTAFSALMGERGTALRMNWFDPQQVEERCGYVAREGVELVHHDIRQPAPPPEF